MSPAEAPATDGPHGPPVGDNEEIDRCIAHPHWWDEQERRITPAAFTFPCFSVDVASLAGSPEATLSRFRPETGLVVFSCSAAKALGCDVRLEPDPNCPELLHIDLEVMDITDSISDHGTPAVRRQCNRRRGTLER